MKMPCANTAALEAMEAAQDRDEMWFAEYVDVARDACALRILHERTEDVYELFCDDVPDALGDHQEGFKQAIIGYELSDVGLIIESVMERIARGMVTADELQAEIDRMAGGDS